MRKYLCAKIDRLNAEGKDGIREIANATRLDVDTIARVAMGRPTFGSTAELIRRECANDVLDVVQVHCERVG